MITLREVMGEVLRIERNRQRRTLREVSARAGTSLGYISELERGVKEPSSEMIEAVCGALFLELDLFLEMVVNHMREKETV